MAQTPNPLSVAVSGVRALRVARPQANGSRAADHSLLASVLDDVATFGPTALPGLRDDLDKFLDRMAELSPDQLLRTEGQAFWLNVYNAGALRLAADAYAGSVPTVLRIPGGFSRAFVTIDGEDLSLDDIEHGKIRRFGDPRIHGALVCGSASCPTLRSTPFTGDGLDTQLDQQMRHFLANGASAYDQSANKLSLSSIFLWYGQDFTRPDLMPLVGRVDAGLVRDTVATWMEPSIARAVWEREPKVVFQPYDWGLGCAVG